MCFPSMERPAKSMVKYVRFNLDVSLLILESTCATSSTHLEHVAGQRVQVAAPDGVDDVSETTGITVVNRRTTSRNRRLMCLTFLVDALTVLSNEHSIRGNGAHIEVKKL